MGIVSIQPFTALGKRLRVRVNTRDLIAARRFTDQQMVVNTQYYFATNFNRGIHKGVQGVINHPFGGVFHRHDAVVYGPRLYFTKYLVDGCHGQANSAFTKVLERRLLRKGTFRA